MKKDSRLLTCALLLLFSLVLLVAAQPEFPDSDFLSGPETEKPVEEDRAPRRLSPEAAMVAVVAKKQLTPEAISIEAPIADSSDFQAISGTVMSERGESLAGVTVTLSIRDRDLEYSVDELFGHRLEPQQVVPIETVLTGPRGRFSLLCPRKPGRYLATATFGKARVSALVSAACGELAPLILRETREVEGRVVDPNDRPIAAAKVVLIPEPRSADPDELAALAPLSEQIVADDLGRFKITISKAYDYAFGAAREGEAFSLVPVPRGSADEVVIRLEGTKYLKGRVLSAGAEVAVVGATVLATAIGPRGMTSSSVVTDEEGRFEIRGLTSLTGLNLRVHADGFASVGLLSNPSALTFKERSPERASVEVRLGLGHRATGVLRDHEGESLVAANLVFKELGSGQSRKCSTDSQGRFSCAGLAVGRHAVSLLDTQSSLSPHCAFLDVYGDISGLVLTTLPPSILHGRLLQASGASLSQARVELTSLSSPRLYATTTDELGYFKIENLPRGPAKLQCSYPGLASRCLAIEVVADLELDALVLYPGATVRGELRGPDGLPCSNAQVVVLCADNQVFLRESSADDGCFVLNNLPSEAFRLFIRWESSPCHCLELEALNYGGTKDLGRIDLEAGRELQVLVRNEAGEAQAGVIVTCRLLTSYGSQDTRIFETNAEGQVNLSGASRGSSLFVMAADADLGVAKLVIGPDQEGLCELQLARP